MDQNVGAGRERVLHVIRPTPEGAIGGASLYVLDISVAQQRSGSWEPLILAPRASPFYLNHLRAAGLEPVMEPRLNLRRLLRLPEEQNIALIHMHGYVANYLVALLRRVSSRWAKVPTVVSAHGWIESSLSWRLRSALDRWCARTADVHIASAKATAARMKCDPEAALVIHNGVDVPDLPEGERILRGERFRKELEIPDDRILIGTVGRLSREKRIGLLLAAGPTILSARPDAHFLVTGGGDQRRQLEKAARRLGLQDHVTFAGLVADTESVYAVLDVLVQPSDAEATPRAVIEAMAHRVPVVATSVGDVPDLLDHGKAGVLVPPDDADALSAAVIELITSPTRANELADRAFGRYHERYTIERMRSQVEEGYRLALQLASGGKKINRRGGDVGVAR